jgi:hypothetical protein
MKKSHSLLSIALLSALSFAFGAGCSDAREVEVKGEAMPAAGATLSGPISIEFFEVPAEGSTEAPTSLKKIELAQAGAFTEMVEVEGDSVRVRALNDVNTDGACNEGEAWAETDAPVKEDGTLDAIKLELSAAACPAK